MKKRRLYKHVGCGCVVRPYAVKVDTWNKIIQYEVIRTCPLRLPSEKGNQDTWRYFRERFKPLNKLQEALFEE